MMTLIDRLGIAIALREPRRVITVSRLPFGLSDDTLQCPLTTCPPAPREPSSSP